MERNTKNGTRAVTGLAVAFTAVVAVMFLLSGQAYRGGYFGYHGMMGYGFYGMGTAFLIASFAMVAILVVLACVLFSLFKPGTEQNMPAGSAAGPADIASERYAKGEISGEEYRRIRENLKK